MPSSACDWSSDVCSSDRSEEHTSELQSRSDLVCRLLLEKKKTRLIKRLITYCMTRLVKTLFSITAFVSTPSTRGHNRRYTPYQRHKTTRVTKAVTTLAREIYLN